MAGRLSGDLDSKEGQGYGGFEKSYQRLDRAMLKYAKIKWAEEQGNWDVKEIMGQMVKTQTYLAEYGLVGYFPKTLMFLAEPGRDDIEVESSSSDEERRDPSCIATKAGRRGGCCQPGCMRKRCRKAVASFSVSEDSTRDHST